MEGNKRRTKMNMILLMMDIPKKVIQLQINIKYLGGDSRVSVECTDISGNFKKSDKQN